MAVRRYDVSYTLSLAALQVPMSTAWEVDPSTNVTAKSLALSENVALGIAISPQEAQARVVDTTLQRSVFPGPLTWLSLNCAEPPADIHIPALLFLSGIWTLPTNTLFILKK